MMSPPRSALRRALACLALAALAASCGGAPPNANRARAERDPDPDPPPLPWEQSVDRPADVASPLVALVGGTLLTATGERI
jgi:hypothetical protein